MVMVTRSARRKAYESCSSSDISLKTTIPPWCSSSGQPYERKKPGKLSTPTWEIQSSYPLRENIWEYLHEDKNFSYKRKNKKTLSKQVKNKRRWKTITLVAFLFIVFGMLTLFWISDSMPEARSITKYIPRTKIMTLLGLEQKSVGEECCYRMKYLAAALQRAEEALKSTLRQRRTMLLAAQIVQEDPQISDEKYYIEAATVSKGSDTKEYGGRVALWGVVPLWRAAPPPETVLALRKPTPADCWPMSGSNGELIIDFPRKLLVRSISIQHVRPDAARSAPRHFILYGVLENNTWIKTVDAEYKNQGPAKQYYSLLSRNIPLNRVIFRVLSNNGNPQYTCIYRVHFYENYLN